LVSWTETRLTRFTDIYRLLPAQSTAQK